MISVLLIASCEKDETLTGYGAAGTLWQLVSLDGEDFAETAMISFPDEGSLAGNTPCNHFSGAQTAPYPWFHVETLSVTRTTCPAQMQETAFLKALKEMRASEVTETTLILSNDAGREMVFTPRQDDAARVSISTNR